MELDWLRAISVRSAIEEAGGPAYSGPSPWDPVVGENWGSSPVCVSVSSSCDWEENGSSIWVSCGMAEAFGEAAAE